MAPSGGNSQSWKFIVCGDAIRIIALPEKDHEVLNVACRGTYIAHGAVMENIAIAARHFGHEASFTILPEKNVSADVTFRSLEEIRTHEIDLYDAIFTRHTNRKPYKTEPLLEDTKQFIFDETGRFTHCAVSTIEGAGIRPVAESSANDICIYLGNQLLHQLLFKEIIWNEDEQHMRGGLFVKTMEAKPPKSIVFKLMRHWSVAKFLKKIGLHKKIYEENAGTMASASLLGAITVPGSDSDFIEAGRLLQNIWLRTAERGLSLHLMTGIVYLWQRISSDGKDIFSNEEVVLIQNAYTKLKDAYTIGDRMIAVTFRIGDAPPPLAVSLKRPPEIDWK